MAGSALSTGWNSLDIPECTGAIQPLHLLVDAQAIFCDGCNRTKLTFSSHPSKIPFDLFAENSHFQESPDPVDFFEPVHKCSQIRFQTTARDITVLS